MTNRSTSIFTRVTPQEKKHIEVNAEKCGISVSEYLRQRALGYSPRATLPETIQALRRELRDFRRSGISSKSEEEVTRLLEDIRNELILPGKEE